MRRNKTAAVLLAGLMALSVMPVTAFAQGSVTKDETVYVNLAGDGSVDAVYVVNAFESPGDTSVTDYGDYRDIKNLTTTDPIAYDNGVCSLNLPAGRFYYQGEMADNALPWQIDISYLLNGKAVSAQELAGASGRLEIHIDTGRGDEDRSSFYDNYVIQMSYTLDAGKCLNVKSDYANIVTAGANINVSYTMMQGSDAKEYVLTADVTDFEMSAIQLRAVHNDADVNTGEFEQKLDDIKADFDELADGVNKLAEAGGSLEAGSNKFYSGLKTFQQSALDIAAASAQMEAALGTLSGKAAALAAGSPEITALAQMLSASPDPQVKTLASAYLAQSQGIAALAQGIAELYAQYQTFNAGLQQLPASADDIISGYGKLSSGTRKLSESLDTLNENVSAIPGQIDEMSAKVDEMLSQYRSDSFAPVSFASPSNSVNSVLFIMKTPKISVPETVKQEEAQPVPQTFFEKLLDLFGLYKG